MTSRAFSVFALLERPTDYRLYWAAIYMLGETGFLGGACEICVICGRQCSQTAETCLSMSV